MSNFHYIVPKDFPSSVRLDQYIASISPDMNRSKLKSGAQELLVNG